MGETFEKHSTLNQTPLPNHPFFARPKYSNCSGTIFCPPATLASTVYRGHDVFLRLLLRFLLAIFFFGTPTNTPTFLASGAFGGVVCGFEVII